MENEGLKSQVKQHWETEACGTRYSDESSRKKYFDEIRTTRYVRTPYLKEFAKFSESEGKRVLEIGVGAGSDFHNWVSNGARVSGVDLTEKAIELTKEHLAVSGLQDREYDLQNADAENLPFPDGEFDIVYSYGVLHHTPNTEAAFREVLRVLRPDGEVRAMIYHDPCWTGFMLWVRYALLRLRPWQSAKQMMFEHLESPGTKAYSLSEARAMLEGIGFESVELESRLCAGDRLDIRPSERFQGAIYKVIWKLYPRWLVQLLGDRYGLNLLLSGKKPTKAGS